MAALAGGAHVVCLAQFDGAAAAESIRHHRITHVIGGDEMFARLAAAAGGRPFDSVRFSAFAAFHSDAAASIAVVEGLGLRPHGLYGRSARRLRVSAGRDGRMAPAEQKNEAKEEDKMASHDVP